MKLVLLSHVPQPPKMKKAIIFGVNGYLGRHIAFALKQQNIECIPIGNAKESIDKLVNYKQIDISEKNDAKKENCS